MNWLGQERATWAGGIIIALISLGIYIASVPLVWDFSTLRSANGLPLAADFATYWSASKLALSGQSNLVYNIDELHEVQQQALGTHHRYGAGWFYPPSFLLVVLPLGLLPYLPAFFIWIIGTLVLYLIVLSRISPHPVLLPLLLLFPGVYENFMFGQNGYLTGMLLGGGLLLLNRSPLMAGCLFGLLSYKPQFMILLFPALIFGGYWKTLIGSLAAALFLLIVSTLLFGYQIWLDYFQVMAVPREFLELGLMMWSLMPTFFAATRSAGFGVQAAYLVQGMVMLAVLAGVAWVWRTKTDLALRGAVLVLGTLLFTPYAFIYDLATLALPLGWLWEEGRLQGRLPGELFLLLLGWLTPIAAPFLWEALPVFQGKVQIGPVIIAALFLLSLVKAQKARNRSRLGSQ